MKKHIFFSISALLISLVLMSNACEKDKEKNNTTENNNTTNTTSPPEKEMEMLSFKYEQNYPDLWKAVDSLQALGLYKSALDVVNTIFDAASKEENAPQVVKAVIYKMKYNSYLSEDDYVVALNELTSISANSQFPLKQLIHSVTAEVYWGYYQSNRWKFYNRTQTINFKNEDIRTWDLNKIADQVNKHYMLSLTETTKSQHTKIGDFSEILEKSDTDKQRPTLYDFLAHRALSYFESTEPGLNRPVDKFIVNGKEYFGSSEEFLTVSTNSTDSLSNALYAVKILKELTVFHLKDKSPEAMIDVELKRLKFAKNHSTDDNKDELYITALDKLAEKYSKHEGYAEIRYYCAKYYNELGLNHGISDEKHKWDRKKAFEICNEAIQKYPDSFGAGQCANLKGAIETKSISFQTETAYQPNAPGKILLNYQNVDSLYFRMIKVSWDYYMKYPPYGEELMNKLLAEPTVEVWGKALQNPGDYLNHSTEIVLNPKEPGQYIVLASPVKDFKLDHNAIAYSSFWMTNLSYNYRRNDNETYDIIVSDRETGAPLKNVKGSLYESKYNYVSRNYEYKKQESYTTDVNGMFTVRSKSDYRNFIIDLEQNGEHFNTYNTLYQYKPYQNTKAYSTTHFYTDRNIYRPGQTIYFKGIKIHHNGEAHTLETGKTTTVTLFDVNYQKISSVTVTTNEYGTFSGSFVAPLGVLTGQMHIQDAHGSKYFSVEEYKRPKFEVDFEPITGVYKIGQKIKVTGTAKAYAGSNIDGANVQYRIVRSCSFPSWSWYRWGYSPYSKTVEIKSGVVKTDENGEFIVEFDATEDPSINKKYYPYYNYQITADVTDITSETHSSTQNVAVGFNALNLSLGIDVKLERNSKNRFKIATTNLNGEKVEASGTITVTKLIEPERLYRSSLWNKPDIQEIPEAEYHKLFPHDQYNNEKDVTKYSLGEKVFDSGFNTAESDSIDFISLKTWKPGIYIVESTCIDSFGENVKDIKYITILDKEDSKNPLNEIWEFTPLKVYCEPGENAVMLISSAAKDLKVLYEIEHKGVIVSKQILTLNGSQQKLEIPILEKHRGNITVHFTTVKFGRTFNQSQMIVVPYSNKELDISFETFRDKLQPGQKEQWSLKIKGPKGEKVAAEMLATMYDASLDAFSANSFYLNVFNSYYSGKYWGSSSFGQNYSQLYNNEWNQYFYVPFRTYDNLNWWGYNNYFYRNYYAEGDVMYDYDNRADYSIRSVRAEDASYELEEISVAASKNGGDRLKNTEMVVATGNISEDKEQFNAQFGALGGTYKDGKSDKKDEMGGMGDIKARSNLNETAFFFPQLMTNDKGEVIISFTIPEALTKWKFLGMAHTKDLKVGYIEKEIVTQKELMVVPNAPRFLREGDKMTFAGKVSNLSEGDMEGTAQLMLFDALTMKPIDSLFKNNSPVISFNAKKGQSARLSWEIEVPFGVGAVIYRMVAKAGNFQDGEEMALPVLSNRMLVTESMPLPSKGIGTKDFTFTKLTESGTSTTIKNHKLTLEYTSNPAWYAVQAIPYMMEYPYECAEQIFTRYYSNAIASHIVNSNPKIKTVFESWKTNSPEAFLSNLEKNQELKSLMLEETPWVLEAQNESERKKRVGLLFDLHKMNNQLDQTINKLRKMQVSNGGWPWFPGMEDSRYITQHIITGMGHLDNLGVKNVREENKVWEMVVDGVKYLDQRILEDYQWLKKHDPNYLTEQRISQLQIQYLYARSYFKDIEIRADVKEAFEYYQKQAATYWKNFNLYNEGMIALQAHRYENTILANQIMASLKERAITHEELGMYWKDNISGYYWYEAPIETQALLIEAFDEVTNDHRTVEELKVWLLKQKQTTDWKTTKATVEACYALLLRGTEILMNDEQVEVRVNGNLIDPTKLGTKPEAGTGYFKTSWSGDAIVPEMGNVSVTRKTEGVSWGAMYWQYFEDLDKITPHETPLKLNKTLFLVTNTASGPVITPITSETKLKPGDKVRVRIELRTDRNMEYVHMKDMRAAGLEPINVFSQYKWQGGLGYYESTKDAATNFFMDYLPKGTYVFEYDLRVSQTGDFSNGIATIQSMYAPEFTSHSEGVRVVVEE